MFKFLIKNKKYDYNFCKKLPKFLYPRYLKKIYEINMGKQLNLKNPKLFTEKIQWLKLYDNSPLKTKLTDKLQAREWVGEHMPQLKFPELYGQWNSFDEIDFGLMPDIFVIKTNHACKQIAKVFNKNDFLKRGIIGAKKLFNHWLTIDYEFVSGLELQYKNIPHKIYIEEYIGGDDRGVLLEYDYKVYCFNGVPKYIEYYVADKENNGMKMVIHDAEWKRLDIHHTVPLYDGLDIPKPVNLSLMLEAAQKLSACFKFARVDLLEYDNQLYFSEITFTPSSGYMNFQPEGYDRVLGDMLVL